MKEKKMVLDYILIEVKNDELIKAISEKNKKLFHKMGI